MSYTQITGTRFQDVSGRPLASGRITFSPVNNAGQSISSIAAGGGMVSVAPVTFLIVNGAITTDLFGNTPKVQDTSATNPTNLGYRVRVVDSGSGAEIQGPGYTCVQPSGSSWSIDNYIPPQPALTTVTAGPAGAPGPAGSPGPAGPAGTVTATGTNGDFNVPGTLIAANFAPTTISPKIISSTYNFVQNLGLSGQTNTHAALAWNFQQASGAVSGYQESYQLSLRPTFFGPGLNLGNSGGWTAAHAVDAEVSMNQRGIGHVYSGVMQRNGVGDTGGAYIYVYYAAGVHAGSDEGVTGHNIEVQEYSTYFHGTIAGTSGTGDTAPTLGFSSGLGNISDGAFLLNISKGTISGSLNGSCSHISAMDSTGASQQTLGLFSLPVTGVTLPVTGAWGFFGNKLSSIGQTADNYATTTVAVRLYKVNGTIQNFVNGYATLVGSTQTERVQITVSAPVTISGALHQNITITYRYPNNGALLFQGGIAGQYLSFDADLAFSGMRTSYFAVGSMTGSDLIYATVLAGNEGGQVQLPMIGDNAASTSGANAGFHLYPGAEVVRSFIDTTGQVHLEQNNVPWAVGDQIENPNYPFQGGHGLWITHQSTTPTVGQFGKSGIELAMAGAGVGGSTVGLRVGNGSNTSQYAPWGGPLNGPLYNKIAGPWGNLWNIDYSHAPGDTMFYITNQQGNTPYYTSIFNLPTNTEGGARATMGLDTDQRFDFPLGIKGSGPLFYNYSGSPSEVYMLSSASASAAGSVLIPTLRAVNYANAYLTFGMHNFSGATVDNVPAGTYQQRLYINTDGPNGVGLVATTSTSNGGEPQADNVLAGFHGNPLDAFFSGKVIVTTLILKGTDGNYYEGSYNPGTNSLTWAPVNI